MRAFLTLLLIGCFLAACSPAPSDEQIRQDFLVLQHTGKIAEAGEFRRSVLGDGWGDGVEIRLYFCERPGLDPEQCTDTYIELAYRKLADQWTVIAISPGDAAPRPGNPR